MLEAIGSWIKDAFLWILQHVLDLVTAFLDGVINTIIGMIPGTSVDTLSVKPYVNVANCWIPLDLIMTLFAAYLLIEGVVLAYRTIKKHIPMES